MSNKPSTKTDKPAPQKKTSDKKSGKQVERETSQSLKRLFGWLNRHQGIIITLVLMTILAVIIMLMSNIFNHANDTSGDLELDTNIQFDQKTIDKIVELDKVDGQIPVVDSSSGRINPFSDQWYNTN